VTSSVALFEAAVRDNINVYDINRDWKQ